MAYIIGQSGPAKHTAVPVRREIYCMTISIGVDLLSVWGWGEGAGVVRRPSTREIRRLQLCNFNTRVAPRGYWVSSGSTRLHHAALSSGNCRSTAINTSERRCGQILRGCWSRRSSVPPATMPATPQDDERLAVGDPQILFHSRKSSCYRSSSPLVS